MGSRDIAKRILNGETIARADMLHPLNVLFQLQDLINTNHFKVAVNKLTASNGVTWVVTVDHPNRPKDAMPWDKGRMEVFHTSVEEHAHLTKDDWDNFLNYTGGK